MFYQITISQQGEYVRLLVLNMLSHKMSHKMSQKLSHKTSNDLRLRILGNQDILGKLEIFLDLYTSF